MNASQTEPALSVSPVTPDARANRHQPIAAEAARLSRQFSDGNVAGLREFLARTRQSSDWQDRILMLDLVAPTIPLDVLETACAIDPDASDLAIVRCAYFSLQAIEHGRSAAFHEGSDPSVRKAAECIRAAMASLEVVAALDSADPTAFGCIMRSLGIFDQLKPALQRAFDQATAIAPELATFLVERQHIPASPARTN
jgi:hypothetical protein